MRKSLIFVLALSSTSVFSQSNNLFDNGKLAEIRKQNPWMKSGKEKTSAPTLLPPATSITAPSKTEQQPAGVLILGNPTKLFLATDKTNYYSMTTDNMPCITPGSFFRSNMPVAGYDHRKFLAAENR